MDVVISTEGTANTRDLAQLCDWLGSAGDPAPWQLAPEPAPSGDSLGIGVEEICAVITAATQLPLLIERIRDWFPTRHKPMPVHLTIVLDPNEPEHNDKPEQRDERMA
jgi:Effector Associated Constant Component 1